MDLSQRDLRFGLEGDLLRHARLSEPSRIIRPFLRQIEAVSDRQARGAIGERERHGHLAVVLFAELTAVLTRDAHRVPAFLWETRVVDDPGLNGPGALNRGQDQVP